MTTAIGVYETHAQAVAAIHELKLANFPVRHVSVLGQADVKNPHSHADDDAITDQAGKGVGIGILAGSTLGILTGVGVFAIPGLGFLFGAGALVGALAGLDLGLIGGGIAGALSIGMHKEHYEKYDRYLKEGKFLLIIHGSAKEIEHAQDILHQHGQHVELQSH
ncbi:MAG TPA: general stress protein [Chitinophagales bacterium]|nr:general stress protein [Chitinophagales bacterium]